LPITANRGKKKKNAERPLQKKTKKRGIARCLASHAERRYIEHPHLMKGIGGELTWDPERISKERIDPKVEPEKKTTAEKEGSKRKRLRKIRACAAFGRLSERQFGINEGFSKRGREAKRPAELTRKKKALNTLRGKGALNGLKTHERGRLTLNQKKRGYGTREEGFYQFRKIGERGETRGKRFCPREQRTASS